MLRTTAATPSARAANVTVRHAGGVDDERALRVRVADSAPRLRGPALVAEAGTRVLAALPLGSGRPIADLFEPTAELVALLELRRDQLHERDRERAGRLARVRRRLH